MTAVEESAEEPVSSAPDSETVVNEFQGAVPVADPNVEEYEPRYMV